MTHFISHRDSYVFFCSCFGCLLSWLLILLSNLYDSCFDDWFFLVFPWFFLDFSEFYSWLLMFLFNCAYFCARFVFYFSPFVMCLLRCLLIVSLSDLLTVWTSFTVCCASTLYIWALILPLVLQWIHSQAFICLLRSKSSQGLNRDISVSFVVTSSWFRHRWPHHFWQTRLLSENLFCPAKSPLLTHHTHTAAVTLTNLLRIFLWFS